MPTLVMHGEDDQIVPVKDSAKKATQADYLDSIFELNSATASAKSVELFRAAVS